MEQKQRSFEVRLKKGEIGEDIIRQYLEKKGWVVYFPFTKNKAHYFDILATYNKGKAIAVDVKTKARFNKWPAQGINIKHYEEYMNFVKNTQIPFYIIFIDDKCGDVHSAELSKLTTPFNPAPGIIAWYLEEMCFLFNIGKEKVNELSRYDQRSYKYEPS